MNTLCDKYVLEFSERLIGKFEIKASPQQLMDMWGQVLADGSITVRFGDSEKVLSGKIVSEKGVVSEKGCPKVLASGTNKGAECGKRIQENSQFCSKHCLKVDAPADSKPHVEGNCAYVMVVGARKGSVCGKKCPAESNICSVHMKAKTKSAPEHSALPMETKVPAKPADATTTYKVTFKQRESGLLAAINETPTGAIFVFNNTKDRLICGKLGPDEKVVSLDEADTKFCRDNNLKTVHPITSKSALEDILEEMQVS